MFYKSGAKCSTNIQIRVGELFLCSPLQQIDLVWGLGSWPYSPTTIFDKCGSVSCARFFLRDQQFKIAKVVGLRLIDASGV